MRKIASGVAVLVASTGLVLLSAAPANAVPISPTVQAAVQDGPFELCAPWRDGDIVMYDGIRWECSYVMGDNPEWQWEPLPN